MVYVDDDPRAVDRGQELVAGSVNTEYIHADACKPDDVLGHQKTRDLIDFGQPVAVLSTAVLHFVSDQRDPLGAVATYMETCAPDSYLALSHVTADKQPPAALRGLFGVYKNTNESIYLRSRDQVEMYFADLEIVPPYEGAEPKVTFLGLWGCEDPVEADDDSGRWLYCGVARRP